MTLPRALQRLIVSFPKMFHLASINIVDDWDRDAKEQVGGGLGTEALQGCRAVGSLRAFSLF